MQNQQREEPRYKTHTNSNSDEYGCSDKDKESESSVKLLERMNEKQTHLIQSENDGTDVQFLSALSLQIFASFSSLDPNWPVQKSFKKAYRCKACWCVKVFVSLWPVCINNSSSLFEVSKTWWV